MRAISKGIIFRTVSRQLYPFLLISRSPLSCVFMRWSYMILLYVLKVTFQGFVDRDRLIWLKPALISYWNLYSLSDWEFEINSWPLLTGGIYYGSARTGLHHVKAVPNLNYVHSIFHFVIHVYRQTVMYFISLRFAPLHSIHCVPIFNF